MADFVTYFFYSLEPNSVPKGVLCQGEYGPFFLRCFRDALWSIRYEGRGGNSRLSPFYASSTSDLLSAASIDDDETSAEKSSPEPTASMSVATTEANEWDQYVEKLGVSKYRCIYIPPGGTKPCGQNGEKRHLVTRHIKAVHLQIR